MSKEERYIFTIEEESRGTRIDRVLSLLLPETSRNYLQKLIEKGNVIVDGTPCRSKKFKVDTGQNVEIFLPEPEELSVEPEDIPLTIVYEDDDLLVVDKPKGMVSSSVSIPTPPASNSISAPSIHLRGSPRSRGA